MDRRPEYIIPPVPPMVPPMVPPQNRNDLQRGLPSPPVYRHADSGDDGRQFLLSTGFENRDDLVRSDERDGFYCGDAIMFYPDSGETSECNGSAQRQATKRRGKNKTKEDGNTTAQNKPHKCIQCTAAFKQRSHLTAHMRTHTGEKPFSCNICAKAFSRIDSATRHLKVHSSKEGKAKVIERSAGFGSPLDSIPPPQTNPFLNSPPPFFNTAIRSKPKKEKKRKKEKKHKRSRERKKPHKCGNCGQSFRQLCHLRVHVRIHSGQKPFKCEVCERTFGRKYSAERHLKMHGGGKIIEIEMSPVPPVPAIITQQPTPSTSVGSMGELLPRLERMSGSDKPFRCNQCTAAFTQRSHLRNHLLTHSGEKPYSCEQCDRTFSRKYSAMRHMRTHTGEKKYKCDFCGNQYSHRFHLRDHIRTHTGERPFKCPVCEKAFARKELAVRHLRTHTDSTAELFDFPETPE